MPQLPPITSDLVPWARWAAIARATDAEAGAGAAISAVRTFLDERHDVTSPQAVLLWLLSQWGRPNDQDSGHNEELLVAILVVVAAAKLHNELALAMLRLDAADATALVLAIGAVLQHPEGVFARHDVACHRRGLGCSLLRVVYCLASHSGLAAVIDDEQVRRLVGGDSDELVPSHDHGRHDVAHALTPFVSGPIEAPRTALMHHRVGRHVLEVATEIAVKQQATLVKHVGSWAVDSPLPDPQDHPLVIMAKGLVAKIADGIKQASTAELESVRDGEVGVCDSDDALMAYLGAPIGTPTTSEVLENPIRSDQASHPLPILAAELKAGVVTTQTIETLLNESRTIDQLPLLAVHVESLLELQARLGRLLADTVDGEVRFGWEKEIQKVFNSLTQDENHDSELIPLLRLAGLHPQELRHRLLEVASASKLQHTKFIRLLHLCPSLSTMELKCGNSLMQSRPESMIGALRILLDERLRSPGAPHKTEDPLIEFISGLYVHYEDDKTRNMDDLRSVALFEGTVVWALNSVSLEQEPFDYSLPCRVLRMVTSAIESIVSKGNKLSLTLVSTILTRTLRFYKTPRKQNANLESIQLRGSCITLVWLLMGSHPSLVQAVVSKTPSVLDDTDMAMKVLLEQPPPQNVAESLSDSRLPHQNIQRTQDAVAWLLWSCIWDRCFGRDRDGPKTALLSVWSATVGAVGQDQIDGRVLILNEVGTIMFEASEEVLAFVSQTLQGLLEHACPTMPLSLISSSLESRTFIPSPNVLVLHHIQRCWALVLTRSGLSADKNAITSMLARSFGFIDSAIEGSQGDLHGLLYCLRATVQLKLLVGSISAADAALSKRIEIAIFRALHSLQKVVVDRPEDALYSQAFVAEQLAHVGVIDVEEIRAFLVVQSRKA